MKDDLDTVKSLARDLRKDKELPRRPREKLGGYALAARALDKCRGRPWAYREYLYNCLLDRRWLAFAGIEYDAFRSFVATGATDQDAAQWIGDLLRNYFRSRSTNGMSGKGLIRPHDRALAWKWSSSRDEKSGFFEYPSGYSLATSDVQNNEVLASPHRVFFRRSYSACREEFVCVLCPDVSHVEPTLAVFSTRILATPYFCRVPPNRSPLALPVPSSRGLDRC